MSEKLVEALDWLDRDSVTNTFMHTKRAETIRKALKQAQGWRPISEAPKDGTRIIALCLEDYTQVVYSYKFDDDDKVYWKSEILDKFVTPEYWMPIPPTDKGE